MTRPNPHGCWDCGYWTGPGPYCGCWRPGARSRSWLRDGCYGWDRCRHWTDPADLPVEPEPEPWTHSAACSACTGQGPDCATCEDRGVRT